MIEINTPDINGEEIIARIREEVQKYKDSDFSIHGNKKGLFSPCPIFPGNDVVLSSPPLPHKAIYALSDFLVYHGPDFIDNAYNSILRRAADSQGKKVYLSKLQNGILTKIDILGRLRYSREGRNKRVPVKGLLRSFIVQSLFKIPVLGWWGRILAGILNLPIILKNIQVLECAVFTHNSLAKEQAENSREHFFALRDHVALVQEEIGERCLNLENKADREDLTKILEQINDCKFNLLDMQHRLQRILEEFRKRFSDSISQDQLAFFANEENHMMDEMYVSFEDRFRGPRDEIKERVRVYLPHVKKAVETTGCLPVLDLGCGRGEWMELLKENDIKAQGVDLNRVMVSQCHARGFDVIEADVITHLRGLNSGTLSVISGFHIVEHLPFKTVIALFDEALRVLKPGGIVIFETPNPENLLVGACSFYNDPTHQNPIPPMTLSFLAEARGFVNVEILRLNQNPSIVIEDQFLNHQFTVGQDYSVIGYRG